MTAIANRPQRVLLVLHQEHSNPGHIGQWFARKGYRLDMRKPRCGDALPTTLAEHAGVVIFGGPMSANDNEAFLARETEFIGTALKERVPLLGICLGAQLLNRHLGGKVELHPEARVEMGYYPLAATEAGQHTAPWPDYVYQWHREGCDLARGARLIATSPGPFPNQAFVYGRTAVGFQFHPEITLAQVHRWTARGTERLALKGARPRHEHIEAHIAHAPKVHAWLDRFLVAWLDGNVLAPTAQPKALAPALSDS
jgi:GMP synthase (glutamine-hydrolysing)